MDFLRFFLILNLTKLLIYPNKYLIIAIELNLTKTFKMTEFKSLRFNFQLLAFLLCPEIRAFQAEVPRGSIWIPVPDLKKIVLKRVDVISNTSNLYLNIFFPLKHPEGSLGGSLEIILTVSLVNFTGNY